MKPAFLIPEGVLAVLPCLTVALLLKIGFFHLLYCWPLKYRFFSLFPCAGESALESLSCITPYYMSLHWRWGSRCYHVSVSSVVLCGLYHSLCCSPQFFLKGNCSICRYKFGMYMGGGEFSLFLLCHLGHLFNCCFKKRYSLDVCASHFNRNYIIGKATIKSK